ncbi:glycosyltransferase [soil metagenome]
MSRRRGVPSARRLQVLHVSVPTSEGTAQAALSYIRDQLSRGWGVTVACPSTGWLAYSARELGADVAWFPATRNPGPSVLDETSRMASIVARHRPDLVHLHSSKAGLVGRLAVRRRIPTIFQPHAWSFLAGGAASHRLALRWEQIGARWTDQLICVGEGEARIARELGINSPASVIPNGVDLQRFTRADEDERRVARIELGLPDVPTVVCVGRLAEQKGQRLLLDAWRLVERSIGGVHLVLVGEGPDRAQLEEKARSRHHVTFVGSRTDVPRWLAAADFVVFPSTYEGAALAPLEAMAVGRCVIASWIQGIEESVPYECGALVDPGNVEALAEAILVRLRSPEVAADEGARGWQHVTAHRDAAEAARRVTQVSLSLLASRRRR